MSTPGDNCRRWLALGLLLLVLAVPGYGRGQDTFVRGNANGDQGLDITDAVFILAFNFQGLAAPTCMDAADANDDGRPDISDAIYILNFLFAGSRRAPPEPYPAPGVDPTPDSLDCRSGDEPPVAVRHGTFFERLHEVAGNVLQLSNRTISIRHFYYDGGGPPSVFFILHRTIGSEREGTIISPELLGRRYEDATLEYPIPPDMDDSEFGYVSVWCVDFELNYGFARLFNN